MCVCGEGGENGKLFQKDPRRVLHERVPQHRKAALKLLTLEHTGFCEFHYIRMYVRLSSVSLREHTHTHGSLAVVVALERP